MKSVCLISLSLCLLQVPAGHSAGPAYFRNLRDVEISAADRQNFIVIDQEIWRQARPDLGDLRLYDGQTPVPYILREQRGGATTQEQTAKILNLGSVSGHTEFDIDMGGQPQYNRVSLQLTAKDFVATAQVEGRNDLNESPATRLGQSTLYDFSREKLGSNLLIQLPPSSFRYLHVRLPADLHADQVEGAAVSNSQESEAAWTAVGWSPGRAQDAQNTVERWQFAKQVPVDRIHFSVAPEESNFRRTVTITDADGAQVTRDEISRVSMTRQGATIAADHLDVDILGVHSPSLTIAIENGDDAPLRGLVMQPLSVQRRIYFEPQGRASLELYYGDETLSLPEYDYAKRFQQSASAVEARLAPERQNVGYTGRPDERPLSERYRILLWAAMALAILVLGGSALRGLKEYS